MEQSNYYQVLGVDENADPDTIEAAYHRLFREYHPDNYPGSDAKEKMALVNMAYEVLSNPRRRAEYDADLQRSSGVASESSPVQALPIAETAAPRAGVWRWAVFAFAVVVAVGVIAWVWGQRGGGSTNTVAIGQEAPEFALTNLQGETISLTGLRGKVIMINFWATWCPPCREEMPEIEEAYQEYKDRGFEVLAVNIQETSDVVGEFVQRFGLSFPVVLDTSGAVSEIYRVLSLPTSYFVDRNGVISDINIGEMTFDSIEAKVKKIL